MEHLRLQFFNFFKKGNSLYNYNLLRRDLGPCDKPWLRWRFFYDLPDNEPSWNLCFFISNEFICFNLRWVEISQLNKDMMNEWGIIVFFFLPFGSLDNNIVHTRLGEDHLIYWHLILPTTQILDNSVKQSLGGLKNSPNATFAKIRTLVPKLSLQLFTPHDSWD